MRGAPAVLLLLGLAGCGDNSQSEPETAETVRPAEPVVVYASYEDGNYLPQLFSQFTEASGIRVTVRTRDQKQNVDDVIANRGSPPADVLLVDDVYELWRAADEGALRPLRIDRIEQLVDARFRDPDGQWVATSVRAATIVFLPDEVDADGLTNYQSLADESLNGRLCLSSSRLPTNRALIAMLIDELGVRPAEIVVRGWIRNLALPPYDSDAELLDAIAAGTCAVGIVSSQAAYARFGDDSDFEGRIHFPIPSYANIECIAVVRHAHEPDAANRLIAWLLAVGQRHPGRTNSLPSHPVDAPDLVADEGMIDWHLRQLSDRGVSTVGWRNEDAVLLAERARYR